MVEATLSQIRSDAFPFAVVVGSLFLYHIAHNAALSGWIRSENRISAGFLLFNIFFMFFIGGHLLSGVLADVQIT